MHNPPVISQNTNEPASSQAVLNVQNLHVAYGAIKALKGISFHVDQGEIVTLIGANGAGKSTTLRTISGLIRPTEGTITFLGQNICVVSPDQIVKAGIAHVPEGRRIFANLSVSENLELATWTRRSEKTAIAADLERVYALFPRLKERIK